MAESAGRRRPGGCRDPPQLLAEVEEAPDPAGALLSLAPEESDFAEEESDPDDDPEDEPESDPEDADSLFAVAPDSPFALAPEAAVDDRSGEALLSVR
ncbi:hypothetical protein GCM10023224_42090 [Streptomonospora halophila]|uniref:Uncharacterized protein n=1 Tax=Streptomonospora halophila TaxID=427369 RepID=A0ABP9GTY5_9ACTN